MINVLSNNPLSSEGDKLHSKKSSVFQQQKVEVVGDDALIAFNNTNSTIEHLAPENETGFIARNDSKAVLSNEISAIEEYKKKFVDNSVNQSLKNLSFDKPASIYRNYVKEQGQKSVETLQKTISSIANQVVTVKEKIAFKNHLKMFHEDTQAMEQLNSETKLKTQYSSQEAKHKTTATGFS